MITSSVMKPSCKAIYHEFPCFHEGTKRRRKSIGICELKASKEERENNGCKIEQLGLDLGWTDGVMKMSIICAKLVFRSNFCTIKTPKFWLKWPSLSLAGFSLNKICWCCNSVLNPGVRWIPFHYQPSFVVKRQICFRLHLLKGAW